MSEFPWPSNRSTSGTEPPENATTFNPPGSPWSLYTYDYDQRKAEALASVNRRMAKWTAPPKPPKKERKSWVLR